MTRTTVVPANLFQGAKVSSLFWRVPAEKFAKFNAIFLWSAFAIMASLPIGTATGYSWLFIIPIAAPMLLTRHYASLEYIEDIANEKVKNSNGLTMHVILSFVIFVTVSVGHLYFEYLS